MTASNNPTNPNETLTQKITRALKNLVVLDITTSVIEEKAGTPSAAGSRTTRSASTKIDLIDGDIANCFHPDFVNGDLKELRGFHEQQVDKGQEIIKNNLEALKSLYELVRDNVELDKGTTP